MASAVAVACTVQGSTLLFRSADGSATEAHADLLEHSQILQDSYSVADGADFSVVAPEGFLESWLQLVHYSGAPLPVTSLLRCLDVRSQLPRHRKQFSFSTSVSLSW